MARFARNTPTIPHTECAYGCPVRRTAQIIDGKWTTQIVRDLLSGKRRYSELLAGLPGISPKILAARLRLLESHGLITKTVYAEVPPHTEYELTALGLGLKDVIGAMARFGELLALRGESGRR
jgi:DNA-binding HxlR family transcriptional regulator